MNRTFRIVLSVIAVIAIVGLGTYAYRLHQANQQLALALEAERQLHINDVAFHTNQMHTFMGKTLASHSVAQTVRYLSDVKQEAQSATQAFSQLPIPQDVGERTTKFVKQVGDVASSLAYKQAVGEPITAQDRKLLVDLKARADQVRQDLAMSLQHISVSGIRMVKPATLSAGLLFRGYQGEKKPSTGPQAPQSMGAATGFSELSDKGKDLPTLIYDGPFSEHVSKEAPRIKGTPINQQQAEAKLAHYLPPGKAFGIQNRSEAAGPIPTWTFTLHEKGSDGHASVHIAKNGGYLVQLISSRTVGESTMDLTKAKDRGLRYLEHLGYSAMTPTYGVSEGGAATVVYAWSDGQVLHYRDQIKLKIALDDGEILAVDARQYLTAHHARANMAPKISAATAQKQVSPSLKIKRVQLVSIPNNAGTGEILCWEFTGTMERDQYLIYVNATSGNEQQILQLIETDQGTFTL
jgi:spore germination protein